MTVSQFISNNNLQPADALELICPQAGFPKHYVVFTGYQNGAPSFIANISDGVQVLSKEKIGEFVQRYQVVQIERFTGNLLQRRNAIKRAFTRVGEKAYSLVFNNCEHFKNWVLYGEDKSSQVLTIGSVTAMSGVGLLILGASQNNKSLTKWGITILSLLVILVFIAFFLWQNRITKDGNGSDLILK